MPAVAWIAASLVFCQVARAAEPDRHTPFYTSESIVNAATNEPGPLAPLGLVSLYGRELSAVTRAISPDDIRNNLLPTSLIGSGVTIAIDNIAVPILFVSPQQVNFLIPGNIRTGKRSLRVVSNGRAGPNVEIQIADSSPGLFRMEEQGIIAVRVDGSLITVESPATPGEVLILYAAGLGITQPAITGLSLPNSAAMISARAQFVVLLNDVPVPDDGILYAGLTPGFAGLYQINCRIPSNAPSDPEIRLRLPGQTSPPRLHLPLRANAGGTE